MAQSGSWATNADGTWTNSANWTGGVIADGADNTATFSLDITADRTVTLGGDRTIGNLFFDDTGASGDSAWILSGSTLTLVTSSGGPVITNNTAVTINSVVGGSAGMTKTGGGILTLSGANTYTGQTRITEGQLWLGASGAIADTSVISINYDGGPGKRFVLNGFNETVGGLISTGTGSAQIVESATDASTNKAATLTLNVGAAESYTYGGIVRGSFGGVNSALSLTKTGAGTQVLSGGAGSVYHSGATTVQQGVLEYANTVNNFSAISVSNGATMRFNTASGSLTNSAGIGGAGVVEKTGGGTRTLAASNTYTGGTTISAGTLQFGTGGSVVGNITNNAALAINRTDTSILSNIVSGTGSLTKAGAGTVTLTGANTYTGATTVAGGTLRIDGNSRLGNTTNALIISNAAVLEVTAAGTLTNALTIGAGHGVLSNSSTGTLVIAGGVAKNGTVFTSRAGTGTNVFTGVISGASANSDFVVDGGTTVFSNVMTYNGPTIITNGGTLVLGVNDAMPAGSNLILGGGTFIVGSGGTRYTDTLGTLTLTADSTIDMGATGGLGTITFADSAGISWATNAVLTITNWQGVANQTSAVTKLLFGTGGLTSTQLGQVRFANQNIDGGTLINGELAPIPEARIIWAAVALTLFVLWRERRRWLPFVRSLVPPKH